MTAPDTPGAAAPATDPAPGRPLRFVALGTGINGNSEVCCRALHDLGDHFLVVHSSSDENTAFSPLQSLERGQVLRWDAEGEAADLVARVTDFAPDAVMCAGWNVPASHRAVMRSLRPPVVRMLFMDSIWRGTVKQWAGRALHRLVIDPMFDVAVVPGERTEFLARRLGFGPDAIIRGAYTADTALFDSGPRSGDELAACRRFLFVGRLIPFKGIEVLARAYRAYRSRASDPWELHVVGMGPEERHLAGIEGVRLHGFRQPPEVAELMHHSSCFVLPSMAEHFGIVVHEAAAAGLPLLVSESAGAVPGLLQDGYNGWAVPEGDVDAWAAGLGRVAALGAERLGEMSAVSRALSTRLSPAGWARNLHEEIERRLLGGRPA